MVRGPDGFSSDNDDDAGVADSRDSRLLVTLPADGEYRISATSYAAKESGQYQLAVLEGAGVTAPRPASEAPSPHSAEAMPVASTYDALPAPTRRSMRRASSEVSILGAQQYAHPINSLEQVVSNQELLEGQEAVKQVYADNAIKEYIVNLCVATRSHPDVYLGVSPRGSLALYRTSQALAAIRNRDYIIPDDVKFLAEPTMAHRLIISPAARIKNVDPREVVQDILSSTRVPGVQVNTR